MPKRVPVHLLDPEGNEDGLVPVIEGGVFVVGSPPGSPGSGDPTTYGEPLSTIVGGKPELVFDDDGGLVWTETL